MDCAVVAQLITILLRAVFASNGKRFLGVFAAEQAETTAGTTPQIRVVLNWFEELKAKVPGPR